MFVLSLPLALILFFLTSFILCVCSLVINHRHDLRTASTANGLTSIFPLFRPQFAPSIVLCTSQKKQVFFRAGVLGQMEEFRDDRLSKIMTWMQSWIRGYLSRKSFKKMQEQRVSLEIVQRNLRKYMKLRTWAWWKLWQKVKPLLNVSRVEDQIAVSIRQRRPLPATAKAAAAVKAANDDARFGKLKRSALTNVVTHRTKISFPSDYVGDLRPPPIFHGNFHLVLNNYSRRTTALQTLLVCATFNVRIRMLKIHRHHLCHILRKRLEQSAMMRRKLMAIKFIPHLRIVPDTCSLL